MVIKFRKCKAEAMHTSCARGLVEQRKQSQRCKILCELLEQKQSEITNVSNGVFEVPEVRDMLEQVQKSVHRTTAIIDDDAQLMQVNIFIITEDYLFPIVFCVF